MFLLSLFCHVNGCLFSFKRLDFNYNCRLVKFEKYVGDYVLKVKSLNESDRLLKKSLWHMSVSVVSFEPQLYNFALNVCAYFCFFP